MSDRDGMNSACTLGDALRALPQVEPQPDLWPGLAQALAARKRRRWRHALPLALAASLALFALVPRLAKDPVAALPAPSEDAATGLRPSPETNGELSALHQRSQTLERWIASAMQAPLDGRDLMAAVEVEDMIGLVDVQLGATRGDADALPLWRQRVALLEDLAVIRGSSYAIAAN